MRVPFILLILFSCTRQNNILLPVEIEQIKTSLVPVKDSLFDMSIALVCIKNNFFDTLIIGLNKRGDHFLFCPDYTALHKKNKFNTYDNLQSDLIFTSEPDSLILVEKNEKAKFWCKLPSLPGDEYAVEGKFAACGFISDTVRIIEFKVHSDSIPTVQIMNYGPTKNEALETRKRKE